MQNTRKNKAFLGILAVILLSFSILIPAKQALAFGVEDFFDPLCVLHDCDSNVTKITTNNTYTGSNVNSPGASVVTNNTTNTIPPKPTPVVINNNNNNTNNNTSTNNNKVTPATFTSPSGSYSYGTSVAYSYNPTPVYNPPVVYTQPVYNTPTYTQSYYPNYNQTYYPTYNQIYVTCSPNVTYTVTGTTVTWTAYASGGNGYFTYSWSGTDGFYGYNQAASIVYQTAGTKYAAVTVSSNGQTYTQSCSNTVTVSQAYNQNYGTYPYNQNYYNQTYPYNQYAQNYAVGNYDGLNVGCYVDPITARIGEPVTWVAEVTGGIPPYKFTWTGTDGLTGYQSAVVKYYANNGIKYGIVTVTSADGKSGTHACTNKVTVGTTYRAPAPAYQAPANQPPAYQPQQNNYSTTTVSNQIQSNPTSTNPLAAATYFSLANVPWGWIAILIIILLFATVLYLLFNRQKI